MEEVLFTDGPDFAVAEEAGQAERTESLLYHVRIVIWPSK
jgi:hypothetical protein